MDRFFAALALAYVAAGALVDALARAAGVRGDVVRGRDPELHEVAEPGGAPGAIDLEENVVLGGWAVVGGGDGAAARGRRIGRH